MVLFAPRRIAKLKQEGRKEGREEGLQEGREEGRRQALQEYNAAVKGWYERFKQAQATNLPFDEPPPFAPVDDRDRS